MRPKHYFFQYEWLIEKTALVSDYFSEYYTLTSLDLCVRLNFIH